MSLRKRGKQILKIVAVLLIIAFIFSNSSYAAMPQPQPGTQVLRNSTSITIVAYKTIGYTLMVSGVTTSVSIEDPAVLYAAEEVNPIVTDLTGNARKKIYKNANGNWIMEASIRVRNVSGNYIWWNFRILLCPAGFNYNSPVLGRSLFDNLFSESGVNKQQLADLISSGAATGWINSIISVRTGSRIYRTHARLLPGMLWSTPPSVKYENATKAQQVYTDNSVADVANWNAYTKENLREHYFNVYWNIPAIADVDRTPPTIRFRNAADTADFYSRDWGNTDVTVRLKFSDSGSGYRDSRYVWSTSTSKPSSGWSSWSTSSNYTVTQTGNGAWYLHVEARDEAGNVAYDYKGPYRIDKAAPTVSFSPNNRDWTNQDITVTITASDTGGSGVKEFYYSLSSDGGSTWTNWTKVTGTSTTVNLTAEGHRRIRAYAVDNAGNTGSTVTSGSYLIDKTNPTHVSNTISGHRYVSGNNYWVRPNDIVTIAIRGSDVPSGIRRHYIRFLGSNIDTRAYHDWNEASNHWASWSPYDDFTHIEIVSVSRTYNSSGQRETTWQVRPKTDGHSYQVLYYYYDYAWNGLGYGGTGYYLRTDGTPPTVTITPNSQSWTNSNITVTISATDSGSGVKRIEYQVSTDGGATWPSTWTTVTSSTHTSTLSTTVTLTNTGQYRIRARATDNVDNTSNIVTSGVYQIDKIAPEPPSITLSTENWTNGNVTVTIIPGTDAHSGVDRTEYRINGGNWQVYSSSFVITSEGITTVEARTIDRAGNISSISTKQARIDRTGPTAPIINVDPPTWTNQNVTVAIIPGEDNLSGINRTEYRINGGAWTVYHSRFTISAEGIHTIEARTIDNAGNSSPISSAQARIDKTAPVITATPPSRDWSNTDVTVIPAYSDAGDSGFKYRQYAWSTSTAKPSAWTNYTGGNLTQTGEGVWYLHLQAEDNAGNYTYAYFGPYKIDKTRPAVTANPSTREWGNTGVTVTLTYSDSGGSGLTTRQYAWSTSTATPSTWTNYTSPVTQSGEGMWYLHVRAVDAAGNVYTAYFGPYKIDRTPPTVSANPFSREWGDTSVTVALTFSDTGGSGIKDRLYAWSTDTATPTEWNNYESPVTQITPGVWYLHVKVTDTAGNVTTTYFGPYTIDGLKYIEVIPSAVTIVRTETLQLTVKAVYHLKTEDITTSAQYSSSNASIVTVSPNGTITGRAVGQAVITAVYKGKQAQCTVTVQEPEKTVAGTITITKTPTYVFTRWNKTADGQPSRMDITISWDNLNLLILRADKTVLRSEPITVTRAESQHRINRYTVPETYSWGTLTYSKLTNYSAGSGSYRAVYEYDKAGKPNSPFTFTGYYTCEGEEKSFSVTVYIPVNGIATTLLRPSVLPLSLGFQPALTNSGNNTWKYSGVWPASGVLTLGGSAGDLAWPVPGSTVISSYFGMRVDPIDGVVRMHYGIDIPAPEGTNIVAPDNGKVVYTGYSEDFGNILVIRSGIYDFIFGHCSNILVSNGQTVSKGQAIAKVGSTGRATGPHLDFRVTLGPYTQGNYIDPLTVVNPTK